MIEPIPTVLVVDDSPTVRKIVQMTLQRERIRVITAGDGLSASHGRVHYLPNSTEKLAVSRNTYYYAEWEGWFVRQDAWSIGRFNGILNQAVRLGGTGSDREKASCRLAAAHAAAI